MAEFNENLQETTFTIEAWDQIPPPLDAVNVAACDKLDVKVQSVSVTVLVSMYTPPPLVAVLLKNVQLASVMVLAVTYTPPPTEELP